MLDWDPTSGSKPPSHDPRPGARVTVSLRRETYQRLLARQMVRESLDALVRRLLSYPSRPIEPAPSDPSDRKEP